MKRQAIIIDLDGTLCASQMVGNFADQDGNVNWDNWMKSNLYAPVNEWCRNIVNNAKDSGTHIVFLTARSDNKLGREVTTQWLNMNGFMINNPFATSLFMRPSKDKRPGEQVKKETYFNEILPYFDIIYAIDDKKSVVDMWRSVGVPALHCADY